MKYIIKFLEALLCIIALFVFVFLTSNHTAPWILIAVYWGVLTVKNYLSVADKEGW